MKKTTLSYIALGLLGLTLIACLSFYLGNQLEAYLYERHSKAIEISFYEDYPTERLTNMTRLECAICE